MKEVIGSWETTPTGEVVRGGPSGRTSGSPWLSVNETCGPRANYTRTHDVGPCVFFCGYVYGNFQITK